MATAELTELLREADGGTWWRDNAVIDSPNGTRRLGIDPSASEGRWAADEFDRFIVAREVSHRRLRKWEAVPGVGGTLVGVKSQASVSGVPDPLIGRFGVRGPMTATLDFGGVTGATREVRLALHDPERRSEARIAETTVPSAGDFSAPIASFPHRSETVLGLLAMIFADRFSAASGLYMIGPYHADRVPVVLDHRLLSTPQMWADVINELEADPTLRGRLQFWVFWYPTGTPITYNALKLREDLATAHRRHRLPLGVALIGRSMGRLLARLQVSDPAAPQRRTGARSGTLRSSDAPMRSTGRCPPIVF